MLFDGREYYPEGHYSKLRFKLRFNRNSKPNSFNAHYICHKYSNNEHINHFYKIQNLFSNYICMFMSFTYVTHNLYGRTVPTKTILFSYLISSVLVWTEYTVDEYILGWGLDQSSLIFVSQYWSKLLIQAIQTPV